MDRFETNACTSIDDTKVTFGAWRHDYNDESQPDMALNNASLAVFARQMVILLDRFDFTIVETNDSVGRQKRSTSSSSVRRPPVNAGSSSAR